MSHLLYGFFTTTISPTVISGKNMNSESIVGELVVKSQYGGFPRPATTKVAKAGTLKKRQLKFSAPQPFPNILSGNPHMNLPAS